MRKAIVSVPMICLLLVSACMARAPRPETHFEEFRRRLLDAGTVTAEAELTAAGGATVSAYALGVTWDGEETVMEIRKPALIAGVKAVARWGEGSLAYDGVMLGTGPVDGEGHTPVSAVPAVLEAMAGGYTELVWQDGAYLAARLYVGEDVRCTVWIDPETLVPVTAELSEDGTVTVSCAFSDWRQTPGAPEESAD